jgi:hypothetical protein
VKRLLIIGLAVVVFLAISVVVARWLSADTDERGQVTELLRAQVRGDADAVLRKLDACRDPACIATVRANARKLKDPGAIKIALYQSQTAHAVRSRTKPTRVVWFTRNRLTTVQCVLVRRSGNALTGVSVSLLRLSAPIGRESSCP